MSYPKRSPRVLKSGKLRMQLAALQGINRLGMDRYMQGMHRTDFEQIR